MRSIEQHPRLALRDPAGVAQRITDNREVEAASAKARPSKSSAARAGEYAERDDRQRPGWRIAMSTRVRLAMLSRLFAAVVTVAGAGPAHSGSSGFRCPSTGRLVSLGQSPLEVRNKCREPDDVRSSVELRTVRETVRRWVHGASVDVTVERTVEVPVEEWTYDFGPSRFIQFLRFENARLFSVGEGEKGSVNPSE